MSASPWVKWFSADFLNGISDLEPNEIAIYSVVLNLIYDNEGPIKDDAVKIGRRCNMRPTSAEKSLASLSSAGKITRENGEISNHRCEKEIKSRQKVSEKSSESANTRWKNQDKKPRKINEAHMQTQSVGICETDAIYKPEPDIKKTEPLVPIAPARKAKKSASTRIEILPFPPPPYIEDAIRIGLDQQRIPSEFSKYQDHHKARGNRMDDWPAAWRTWCRKSIEYSQNRTSPFSGDRRNERSGSIFESLDRLEAGLISRPNYEPEESERSDSPDNFGGRLQLVAVGNF